MKGIGSFLRKAWKLAAAPMVMAAAMTGVAHANIDERSFDPQRAYAQRVANEVGSPVTYINGEIILPAADVPVRTTRTIDVVLPPPPPAVVEARVETVGLPLDLTVRQEPAAQHQYAADEEYIINAGSNTVEFINYRTGERAFLPATDDEVRVSRLETAAPLPPPPPPIATAQTDGFLTARATRIAFVPDEPAEAEEIEITVTARAPTRISEVGRCNTGAARRATAVTIDRFSGDAICSTRGDEVRVAASPTKLWGMAALYDAALERAEGRTAVPQTIYAAAFVPGDPRFAVTQAAWSNLLDDRQTAFGQIFSADVRTQGGYRVYGRSGRVGVGRTYTLGHLTDLATVYSANDAMQEVNIAVGDLTGSTLIERMPGVLLQATQRGEGQFFCQNLGQANAGDVTGERWDTRLSACQLAYLTRWTHNNFTTQFEDDFSIRGVRHRGRNYEHSGIRFDRLSDRLVAGQRDNGETIVDYNVQVKTGWNRRAHYTGVLDFTQTVRHDDLGIECDRGVITAMMGGVSMNDRSTAMMRNVRTALGEMREDERATRVDDGDVIGAAANRCYVIGERAEFLVARGREAGVLPAVENSMPDRPRILDRDFSLAAFNMPTEASANATPPSDAPNRPKGQYDVVAGIFRPEYGFGALALY